MNTGTILNRGRYMVGKLAGLLTTPSALVADKLMFFYVESGFGQIKYLLPGHHVAFSGQD